MEIFSLSGTSGTGKSTSALSFAYKHKIPAIIDDGLLIVNGQKVAGTSAKFEKNSLTAVKRATFFYEDHRKEVQAAIQHFFVSKILIIGTSDRMVKLIASRLEIGDIQHIYHVEDVRTSSEIKIAQFVRRTEGKHVIPIPYKQVEQNFFKKLVQRGVEIFSSKKERIGETTIVHPDFHRGAIHIHKKVFKDLTESSCLSHKEVEECQLNQMSMTGLPVIKVTLTLVYPIAENIFELTKRIQEQLQEDFLRYLSIELESIHISIQMTAKKKKLAQ
ncbi:putative alkaline shock family protein YloU [Bacillus ectoiniformans]|uniref:hypothetical protein n=1 Tax=Bacillus ectoiniformans TaxID=1494429 RepID=UPI0019583588|nr:hypothetical protein [Bacillus ectoiniformans]MBM7649668.1 putative alkaline shock family protein YloU [Bacillus ectoiniformans]